MKTEQIGTLAELDVKPGDVVQYTRYDDAAPRTIAGQHENGNWYTTDMPCRGKWLGLDATGKWRIISRATPKPSIDLTAITTPFGLLDKATQDALIAHGGPYQMFGREWENVYRPAWCGGTTYRVKPGPKRETVTKDGYLWQDGRLGLANLERSNCTITYDTIDGVIDVDTYRVTKKE